jgi:hypothetical protein
MSYAPKSQLLNCLYVESIIDSGTCNTYECQKAQQGAEGDIMASHCDGPERGIYKEQLTFFTQKLIVILRKLTVTRFGHLLPSSSAKLFQEKELLRRKNILLFLDLLPSSLVYMLQSLHSMFPISSRLQHGGISTSLIWFMINCACRPCLVGDFAFASWSPRIEQKIGTIFATVKGAVLVCCNCRNLSNNTHFRRKL